MIRYFQCFSVCLYISFVSLEKKFQVPTLDVVSCQRRYKNDHLNQSVAANSRNFIFVFVHSFAGVRRSISGHTSKQHRYAPELKT